jgi:protein-L-isoaspartate(D-aspartate) O-methyltransferase
MINQDSANLVTVLRKKGITDERVLNAIKETPRHLFIPPELRDSAYHDNALPIAAGQTISQPYIVALMTQTLLQGKQLDKVLEIGTGSGYQSAILSRLVNHVYSVERINELAMHTRELLAKLQVNNVSIHYGDGSLGLEQYSPYDGIIVTAAASEVPQALLAQLKEGARLVIPVGNRFSQELRVITREGDKYTSILQEHVIFVPLLTGLG